MPVQTDTRPWQRHVIDQLATIDTEGMTHAVVATGDTPELLALAANQNEATIAAEDYAARGVYGDGTVEAVNLDELYHWHKQQLAEVDTDPDTNDPQYPETDAADTDSDADDRDIPLEPNADTGKLFETPRVAVALDDTDPTVIKIAFSGSIELNRTDQADVAFYNRLAAGKTVALEIEAHVKGAATSHRRDNEGNVDAVVQTKTLTVHSIDNA